MARNCGEAPNADFSPNPNTSCNFSPFYQPSRAIINVLIYDRDWNPWPSRLAQGETLSDVSTGLSPPYMTHNLEIGSEFHRGHHFDLIIPHRKP
ncbi:hypothetical protein CEXT_470931 [Caerostris extrusa]|uniref:Uncharacterized protein n=1 Tax=Caerostris extrusa TaxID=172846 RepID=A0AAV4XXC7_CAEEX|nr:hypothetical protein CEXT_470931 [Caerostris extrusa]